MTETELERVRYNPATRASSPTDPIEWSITEDGYRFGVGDRVYNYYDGEWVTVIEEPNEYDGWFDCRREDGRLINLNSVRISANEQ